MSDQNLEKVSLKQYSRMEIFAQMDKYFSDLIILSDFEQVYDKLLSFFEECEFYFNGDLKRELKEIDEDCVDLLDDGALGEEGEVGSSESESSEDDENTVYLDNIGSSSEEDDDMEIGG